MSWTLEIFSSQSDQVTAAQLATRLGAASPVLIVVVPRAAAAKDEDAVRDEPQVRLWQNLTLAASDASGELLADLQAIPFAVEREADLEVSALLAMFEAEIVSSDLEDGGIDEEYSSRLRQMLQDARWHYTISVRRNDRPEQERAVVQAAYAISLAGGVVHDLQSGAWMDAELFENLLDAYGVADDL